MVLKLFKHPVLVNNSDSQFISIWTSTLVLLNQPAIRHSCWRLAYWRPQAQQVPAARAWSITSSPMELTETDGWSSNTNKAIYPLVMTNITIEDHHRWKCSWKLAINSGDVFFNGKTHDFDWAIFYSYVSHYQRVSIFWYTQKTMYIINI